MEQKKFEITMLGKDISIISDDLNYATLGKGSHHELQVNTINEFMQESIKDICADIHLDILKLMKRLEQIKNG